jgi:hypothetical protein
MNLGVNKNPHGLPIRESCWTLLDVPKKVHIKIRGIIVSGDDRYKIATNNRYLYRVYKKAISGKQTFKKAFEERKRFKVIKIEFTSDIVGYTNG